MLPVIGFLYNGSIIEASVAPFRRGLNETGYVEGRNVAIEYRGAEDHYERLPGLAADLVSRKVAVIAAVGALPAILAAKAATTTIPIVFAIGGDPVQLGLVTSLNRPAGNLTGATNLNGEILPKRLQLLHEFVPNAAKVALLVNPTNPATETQLREVQDAARILGLQLITLHARAESEFDSAFSAMAQLRAAGLVIAGDGLFFNQMEKLAQLALLHRVPAIFQARRFVAAGGLISYGGIAEDAFRIAGVYTGRILKAEKRRRPDTKKQIQSIRCNFTTIPCPTYGQYTRMDAGGMSDAKAH